MRYLPLLLLVLLFSCKPATEKDTVNDFNTPLHLMKPEYVTPYGLPDTLDVKRALDRVYAFLEASTPTRVKDKETDREITDFSNINEKSVLERGTFRLTSYEWGVTYGAMLEVASITGDSRYAKYVEDRFRFLSELAPYFDKLQKEGIVEPQMRQVVHPEALDDAGAMCVAMIKARLNGIEFNAQPLISNYIDYIMLKEYRLADGTFARNRPHHNTIWLDDMFMSVPAIVQMGRYTGENRYYDEAIKQILQFASRMWIPEKNLFRHGWVEAMDNHPSFHWARANGWAILAITEVLDVLPESYAGRDQILALYRNHVRGLIQCQSGEGFWHQLLDRNDSYLETSATAIFTYCIARGINQGWLDDMTYGPAAVLGWNAVATKINPAGEVEGTCVGTGMAFDPAFYYYRPVHRYAAHGYGPVLFAGAEMIRLIRNTHPKMNDSGLQFYPEKIETDEPIFWLE
jgi:rhamnogalacturonyl hydrolase YesR